LAQAPIDYHQTTAGLKGVWRPRGGGFTVDGLAIIAGYEYNDLERTNAIFTSPTGSATPNVEIDESHTITNGFQVGPDYRWSRCFDTFLRYKFQTADQPEVGFKQDNGVINTLLPQQDHIVEAGFNWFPSDRFMLNASMGFERGDNHSSPSQVIDPSIPNNINFGETNYPITMNVWYGATPRWSFSAGYAFYSNFVAQDIVIGDDPFPYTNGSIKPATARWTYGGQAEVVSLGTRFVANPRVTFTGRLEWVRGHDLITNSATFFPAVNNTVYDLGSYSEVLNETTRLSLGADWRIRPRTVTYVRYELYNFNDVAPGYQSGLAQGILGGFLAMF
jgi:hypothetical protein